MTQFFQLQPDDPQARLLRQALAIIRRGGLVVYPTDSGYALGCQIGNREAYDRILKIRQLDETHNMSLVMGDLNKLGVYAEVKPQYVRLLQCFTPGAYTFLLKATAEVPRVMHNPNRHTVGIRIPDHPIALGLLEALAEPLISTTLILPNADAPLIEPAAIRDLLGHHVDLIIDGGNCGLEPTTVIDLTQDTPRIVRKGKGDPVPFVPN